MQWATVVLDGSIHRISQFLQDLNVDVKKSLLPGLSLEPGAAGQGDWLVLEVEDTNTSEG